MMLELSKDSMRTGVGIPMSLPRFSMAPWSWLDLFKKIKFLSQTDTGIFRRQINQLLLLATLRFKDLDLISN